MPSVLVTPREHPDLDGVACAIAYAELLCARATPATPLLPGRPDAEACFVLEQVDPSRQPRLASGPSEWEGVVLVDMSGLRGLPAQVEPTEVIEVIDHRAHHEAERLFPNARVQIELVGAAATLVFERFMAAQVQPSRVSATLLQAAIHSNTQRLAGSVTTPRDRSAAASLAELWPLPPILVDEQFRARGTEILEDLDAALRRETKTFDHPGGAFTITQLECPSALGLAEACTPGLRALGQRALLNLVDPDLAASLLVASSDLFARWLFEQTGLRFVEDRCQPPTPLLRKQLVARIMETDDETV